MYFSIHSTASLNVDVLLAFMRRALYWKYGFILADSIHALETKKDITPQIKGAESYQRQVKIFVYSSLKQDILNTEKNLRKKATLTHNIFHQLYL